MTVFGRRVLLASSSNRRSTSGLKRTVNGRPFVVTSSPPFGEYTIVYCNLSCSISESAVVHSAFLIGFLVLLVGSLLLGVALIRVRRDPPSRLGSLLFALALPLDILLTFLGGAVAPGTDIGFWAAITVPYGSAWVLLRFALSSSRRAVAGQPSRVS